MLELLTEWLPLLLAGFATGLALAARVRARRDRADVARELHATQRVVATTYCSAAVNAGEPLGEPVVRSLANLVVLEWLELDEIPATHGPHANVRSRVRIELENREADRRIERLRDAAGRLQASLDAMARGAVQDY